MKRPNSNVASYQSTPLFQLHFIINNQNVFTFTKIALQKMECFQYSHTQTYNTCTCTKVKMKVLIKWG